MLIRLRYFTRCKYTSVALGRTFLTFLLILGINGRGESLCLCVSVSRLSGIFFLIILNKELMVYVTNNTLKSFFNNLMSL